MQLKEKLVTTSRSFFVFHNLIHKKEIDAKQKSSQLFHGLFLKILHSKNSIMHWLFRAIYQNCGTFFIKDAPYLIHYQMIKFQYLRRVTQWFKALQLKLKGSWFKAN